MSVVAILAITMGFRDWMQVCLLLATRPRLEPPRYGDKLEGHVVPSVMEIWRSYTYTYLYIVSPSECVGCDPKGRIICAMLFQRNGGHLQEIDD